MGFVNCTLTWPSVNHTMTRILPHTVWIGSVGTLRDLANLHAIGIRAIVHLAYEEAPPVLPREFITLRFPLLDGEGNDSDLLKLAIDSVTRLLDSEFATLVCCQAGLSRSPAIVAAAIARHTRQPFAVALRNVANLHPCAIHPSLYRQVESLMADTITRR